MSQPQSLRQKVEHDINIMKPQWKALFQTEDELNKFARVLATALLEPPSHPSQDLHQAEPQSLWAAATKCAQDGLLPDGREATFSVRSVKTKNAQNRDVWVKRVVYSQMVEGVIKLITGSGTVRSINAHVVKSGDHFDHWIDDNGEHFKHVPKHGARGEDVLTYAYARLMNGDLLVEVIDEDDMANIEACALQEYIWQGPFRGEMKRKSAIHRISKKLSKTPEIQRFQEDHNKDFDVERLNAPTAPERSEIPAPTQPLRLEQAMDQQSPEPPQDIPEPPAPEPQVIDVPSQQSAPPSPPPAPPEPPAPPQEQPPHPVDESQIPL